ncbi:MAG: rhodanese-like domain-containing protein [Bdellovibrionaceae bacterium]|nr:rhodanese-like domain-containing protein [Pseudobdellovibrionaceae bacterium]
MSTNSSPIILDVRTVAEYQQGHAQNSINIDFYAPHFLEEIQKLDKSKKYELYCRSGNRSGQAEAIMKQMGFAHAMNIGGLDEATTRYSFEEAD